MTLAEWLQDRRLSQAAFAEQIGSSQPQVARFLAGTRIPNRAVMLKIVAVTAGAVTANDFYREEAQGTAA